VSHFFVSRCVESNTFLFTQQSVVMQANNSLIRVACLLTTLLSVGLAAAEESAPPAGAPEAIQQNQPNFYVHAEVDRASHEYAEGDPLSLHVTCEVDAYVYVIYKQVDGKTFQIFPNSGQTKNRLPGKEAFNIPAQKDAFRWKIGPPYGEEIIKVIASKEPLKEFVDAGEPKSLFTPVSASTISAVTKDLDEKTPARNWAETTIKITTVKKRTEPEALGGKRFGVFVGANNYEFFSLFEPDCIKELDVVRKDALQVSDAFKRFGKLNDSRVLVAENATRDKFGEAVSKWLPSVSKPGDTVVIYFAGHGINISDDDGDEAGGKDSLLLTRNMVDLPAFIRMNEMANQGKLDPGLKPRFAKMADRLVAAGISKITKENFEQADNILMRDSCVSDDLFGHWLQSLTGRKVIVILDSCHSGGFGKQGAGGATKDLTSVDPAAARSFRFLSKQVGRLKDIGQPDCALLTACRVEQTALAGSPNADQSLFTWSIMTAMQEATTPLNVQQTYQQSAENMKLFFNVINASLIKDGKKPLEPHEPFYADYCKPPAIVKP
jgi:hypothetical protein